VTTDVRNGEADAYDVFVDESYEFALRRAARFMSQSYSRYLYKLGLTAQQFTIMRKIKRHGSVTMAELVELLGADRSTLVRAVQVLRKDGFVASTLGPPPGRRNVLTLTPLGADRIEQARSCWWEAQREFEARFGVDRAQRLRMELFGITGYAPATDPVLS
jgi:DNA-binding MarR family transcriptional regulator